MRNVTYINAGAGSGKTYTLTRILAEKLSERDDNDNPVIMPSQVILTTFTDLAAAEFREKARVQILENGNFRAAAQMDSAAIGTVHSVALQFIKKFWYLLDYGAEIKTISERDEDFYMSQSLARIVSEKDENGKLIKQQDLKNFRRFRDYYDICDGFSHPDYLFWQRHLNEVVEKMDYYEVNEIETSIEKSLETLKALYTSGKPDYSMMAEALKEYGAFCQGRSKEPGDKAATQAATIVRLLKMKPDHSWLMEVKELMSDPVAEKSAQKDCVHYAQLINALEESATSTEELVILEPFVKSIFTLAKDWRDDYKQYKKLNHIISYNDMERLFLYLITEEQEVKDYVREHYRLIMVDEFQDSNPIQLKIFNRLSELIAQGDGHSYWVGDPKQAIYGFRGADTDLVNSVSERFAFYNDDKIHPEEGDNHLGSGRLVESWRSRKTLVELVNQAFYIPFKEEDNVNELCITLNPHFTEDTLQSPPLVHWECNEGNKSNAAEAMAYKVKELLSSKIMVHRGKQDESPVPIEPIDIAILARTNSDIKDIVKALRKYGVPVSEPEDAIMQRIEVQLVVTLLQYMQNPSNKHVIADIMRMMCGECTSDILKDRIEYVAKHQEETGDWDQWKHDDEVINELLRKTARFKHLSIPEMVKGLIYECNIPALTSRWGEGRIRQQNLSTLQHLADDYDEMCLQMGLGTSISGFIYYLNSVEPDKEKDNQSNTVKVFTYHGSKGLEWPVVILHGLGKDSLEVNDFIKKSLMKVRELVLCDKSTLDEPFAKSYYLHFYPFILKSIKNNVPTSLRDKIAELDFYQTLRTRAKGEERRLLYVGMTRAKDYLYFFGHKGKYAWLENAGIPNPAPENIWGNGNFKPHCEEIKKPEDNDSEDEKEAYEMVKKPNEHFLFEKRYLSPSKILSFEGYTSHHGWKEHGVEMDHRGWGDDYAAIGSCIHDIFAIYHPDTYRVNHDSAVNIIGGYGLANKLAGHIDALLSSADWLYSFLQQHFPQTAVDVVCTEYPFQTTLPSGQTLRGEMDLLWFYSDEKGKHCVLVDYKTFPGVNLHEHTKGHYAQLSAYASALNQAGIDVTHALIYYPVHGVIHELQRD